MTINNINTVIEKVYRDDTPDLRDIEYLLSLQNEEDMRVLFNYARMVVRQFCGDAIFLRGIVEFSSYCPNTCSYCGLNRYNKNLERYRLTRQEIMQAVGNIADAGIKTVVLQSGEDEMLDTDEFAEIIAEIKQKFDMAVTLSVGERDFEAYRIWKQAGADRYLLKIETSDKELYESLHPEMSFENRLECTENLKLLGYQAGSGFIVGLKGQTIHHLAKDMLFLKNQDFDMVSVGLFIPHDKTPLKNEPAGNLELTLKTIAVARIVTKKSMIPATTSIGNIGDSDQRITALNAGANVIMINFTPIKYKKLYSIYPSNGNITNNSQEYLNTLEEAAKTLNRKLDYSRGDSLKQKQKSLILKKVI